MRGRVWKLGDDISTDLLLPGRAYIPLQALGIQPVIAESVARLFFGNEVDGEAPDSRRPSPKSDTV